VENFVPVAFIASTTRRLNPQRGASGLPFMNNRTSLPPSKALMRSSIVSAFVGVASASAALSDPSPDISSIMSHPPSSSPFT